MSSLGKLLNFLNKLDEHGFDYSLEHGREDTLTVLIRVPGERWEAEFHDDGHVDVEVFYSSADEDGLESEAALERLFTEYEEELEDDEFDEDEDDDEDDDYDDEDETEEPDRH